MYFVLFGCIRDCWAELVQKFVPRNRVRIFRNECTRSTQLVPKLTFWCVSYYLGAFGTVWLPYETQSKTGRTSAKVRNRKSRRNLSQQTHPFHPIGPQTHVLAHFELFGCIWDNCLPYETRCKMDRTCAKSSFPRSRIEIFRNERTLSHCILKLCLGVF